MANEENLQPVKSKKEARERGKNGGIKSGIAKREKKLMSQVYLRAMAEKYKVNIGTDSKTVDWDELLVIIIRDIMMKKDSCSVSLMREIREATEGQNVNISGLLETSALTPDERKVRIAELEKKRAK